MTVKDLIEMTDDYGDYLSQVEIYVNGKPADDVSFGLVAGTGQMIVNIESYDPD